MPTADLILENARVIPVDPEQPAAGAIAIKDDKILLVTNAGKAESVRGRNTKTIDCHGKTLVPGFNDAHCHIFSNIRKLLSIDLSPTSVSSIDDIKAAICQHDQNIPRGKWLSGTDYNEFYLAEKRHPTRWDIDEVAPDHPVVLSHRGLHTCVLNSLALSLAGITRQTPNPPGAIIEREPGTGEPTGLLSEMLGHIREKVMPQMTDEDLITGITLANEQYLAQGITSLQDATVVNDLNRWHKFRSFIDTGKLKSRVYMMPGIDTFDQFYKQGLLTGSGDNRLRLGAVKIILSETGGQVYPPQPDLNQQVLTAHNMNYQIAIHAVKPNMIDAAITALEYINRPSQTNLRHRIEHCSECPPNLLERLTRLKPLIITQPAFLYYGGERILAEVASGKRSNWLFRIKSFLDSGLIVAGSSDSPVAPNSPLIGIYAAITRQTESGQQVIHQERISAAQTLRMYTINAAYASSEETLKGSIRPGKLADIVILSNDPTRSPPEKVKDIRVEMTIIGGKVVWEA